MNNEIMNKLAASGVDLVKFIETQAPLMVEEMFAWSQVTYRIELLVCILGFLIFIRSISSKKNWKEAYDCTETPVKMVKMLVKSFIVAFCVVGFFESMYNLMMIEFVPRLWLFNHISK